MVQSGRRLWYPILGVLGLVACRQATAQNPSADPNLDVALVYLTTLYTFDFDGLGDRLSPDATFHDPTAVSLTGAALNYSGRDTIVAVFAASAAQTRNAGFEVVRHFTTGEHVVLYLTYRTEINGDAVGAPGSWIPVAIPAVTILRIRDDVVLEHSDFVDYEELLKQINDFKATREQEEP